MINDTNPNLTNHDIKNKADKFLMSLYIIICTLGLGIITFILFTNGVIRFVPEPSWHGLYPGMDLKVFNSLNYEIDKEIKEGRWTKIAKTMGFFTTTIKLKETNNILYSLCIVNNKISKISFTCNEKTCIEIIEFAKKNYLLYKGSAGRMNHFMFTSKFPTYKHFFIARKLFFDDKDPIEFKIEWEDYKLDKKFNELYSQLELITMFSNK